MMLTTRKIWLISVLLLLGCLAVAPYTARDEFAAYMSRAMANEGSWFAEEMTPVPDMYHIFDLGVVDADEDA